MPCTVLVCKNTTCAQQGSAKVCAALQSQVSQSQVSDGVVVKRSGCLGECGNGPMVLVAPDQTPAEAAKATWYSHVCLADVPVIVSQHLKGGKVVRRKLYLKYHPTTDANKKDTKKGWFVVFGILLMLSSLIVVMLLLQSPYGHVH